MINGVKDAMTRGLDRTPPGMKAEKPDKPDKDSFLDRLGGADRTEREKRPGREDRLTKTTREGKRSAESETDSTKSKGEVSDKLAKPKTATKAAERQTLSKKANKPEPDAPVAASLNQPRSVVSRVAPVESRVSDASESSDESRPELTSEGLTSPGDRSGDLRRIDVKREAKADESSFEDDLPGGGVRKAAMQDFLQGMQREFGIPPEKIVAAFNKMDDATLTAAPEAATKEFVKNLGLAPGAAQSKASEMYQTMVQVTGDALLSEELTGTETGTDFDIKDATNEALLSLNDSIDSLNEAFTARPPQGAAKASEGQASIKSNPQLKAQMAAEHMNAQLTKFARAKTEDGKPTVAIPVSLGTAPVQKAVVEAEAAPTEAADASVPTFTPLAPKAAAMGFEAGGMESGAGQSGNAAAGTAQASVSASTTASGESGKAFAAAMSAESSKSKRASQSSDVKVDAPKPDPSLNPEGQVPGQTAPLADLAPQALGADAMLAHRPVTTPADDQANVKELLRQAQVVLKNGGGEIKMDLKPEGVGEVRLKVSVENGQVNVQMLTDNEDTKRLLEKGLHELKADLTAHSLKVDHMKVDVGQELQKHMDKPNDESAREQSRQAAQDFMGQMRDERQAMRQGFMENSGWRSYNQGGKRNSIDPEQSSVASASSAKPAVSSVRPSVSGAGRLNLVA